jgi:hypothetical protein
MNDVLLCLEKGRFLTLKYIGSIHPAEVHIKADHWKFIFQLYCDNKLFDKGLFTDRHFISDDGYLLILEEYAPSITDQSNIKSDEDVILNLRFFDFKNHTTGKFSKITGGRFLVKSYMDGVVVFQKVYNDKRIEYETKIENIGFKEIIYKHSN